MLVLSDDVVRDILLALDPGGCRDLLEILSGFLMEYSTMPDRVHQPSRLRICTSLGHTSLFMPASNTSTTGIKSMTIPADGSAMAGTVTMYRPNGTVDGLLDARELTAFRTSLAANIIFARRRWAGRADLVVFGAGKQAEWHLRIALLLGPAEGAVGRVTVVNRSLPALQRFDGRVLADLRARHPAVDFVTIARVGNPTYERQIRSALAASAVIFTCTPSAEPLFPFAYLQHAPGRAPKRYISLIGSYRPDMQEVDRDTVLSANLLVVDSRKECLIEAGELIMGNVGREQMTEVGELIPLPADDERSVLLAEEHVVFKCVGMGIMDVAVGAGMLDLARRNGLGLLIPDF